MKRTREIIELAPTPVQVIEHRFIERECPLCRHSFTPRADLGDQVQGQQRLGIHLVSLIVTLREVGRLPVRTIQWYLETIHDLHLSIGTITTVSQRVATVAQPAVESIRDQIRGKPRGACRRDRVTHRWYQWVHLDLQHARGAVLHLWPSDQGHGGYGAGPGLCGGAGQ